MKRILILADDQLIANFYREKFEAIGLAVETARNGEAALQHAADKPPDLALIDPVLPAGSGLDTVGKLHSALGGTPMMIFANAPAAIISAMEKAGITKVVARGEKHVEEVLREVQAALNLGGIVPLDEDGAWLKTMIEAAPEAINAMRVAMHGFIKEPQNSDLLFDLFRQIHNVSERTSLVGLNAIYRMTAALEAFVYDLYAMPEQVNPSVIRTVSQSIDFLATLFEEKNVRRAQDPTTSDVLVVDDEADARKLIETAMDMVGLKITCAAEAEMAMTILEDNPFDLIFLDINLPQTSGFDICAHVRGLEDHKKTPIVFLTGMTTLQNRAKSSLSGGNDFVGKPFNILELGVKALTWVFKKQLDLV